MAQLDRRLLEILACPACHADVRQEGDRIVCDGCGRRYPIRDGLPIMLVDEAELPVQTHGESTEEGDQS
ncbi:MAG: Trm112 family protein [Armatimonadetes bacterium]|nr:Trm112 family protein [Armatimonadota bacterium]